jgi:hypothetical protein
LKKRVSERLAKSSGGIAWIYVLTRFILKSPDRIPSDFSRKTRPRMPEVSRFFGIIIRMYYREHNPPHFHAEYSGDEAQFNIESLEILNGRLNARAQRLVREWAALNRSALLENWDRARTAQEPLPIRPLE